MLWQFFSWYLITQLIALAALPLAGSLFVNLADRGYAFSKSLGILLVGLILWLGTSYGLLRNETGGAWLALASVALISLCVRPNGPAALDWRARLRASVPALRYVLMVELLFLVAFAAWAYVRAHDPGATHTEKPMDLMLMNSIWHSPTYPPQDAWLSGYAISYYYFGYWLLTTLARLAGQPPNIAYNVGQACWFGLLLIGSLGIGYNLLRHAGRGVQVALAGGLLSALAVGLAGNGQIILEWLYANGVNVAPLATLFGVNGFPPANAPTGQWYIDFDWWWWRSSRVLRDLSLLGEHREVIDEFPSFSYVLGDNHPHVLAMPFVILVIAMAQNLFFAAACPSITPSTQDEPSWRTQPLAWLKQLGRQLLGLVPLGLPGLLVLIAAVGALIFLNTWDFPPYWLLVTVAFLALAHRGAPTATFQTRPLILAGALAALLLIGAILLYLPYFLTAQSQAGGVIPNFFYPTRFAQFVLMFGFGLCGLGALIALAWPLVRPARSQLGVSAAIIFGGPLIFLAVSLIMAFATSTGQELLAYMALPEGSTSHLPFILERWATQGFTFLLIGVLLTIIITLGWQLLRLPAPDPADEPTRRATLFALLLAAIGLLLAYGPEFVFLRDQFGYRMNTIFKFYYQAWLLFGLSTGYAIIQTFAAGRRGNPLGLGLATLSTLLIGAGLLFPVAGAYSKTQGFSLNPPTFDAIAYVANQNPAELAAIQWVEANTAPDALIVQAIGNPYASHTSRLSTATGRPTLLGWDGHERQWRGDAYGAMAAGRGEALELIYRSGSPEQIAQTLATWQIDYVYVGSNERNRYGMTPFAEERLLRAMNLVFEQGDVRIYERRGG